MTSRGKSSQSLAVWILRVILGIAHSLSALWLKVASLCAGGGVDQEQKDLQTLVTSTLITCSKYFAVGKSEKKLLISVECETRRSHLC